MSTKTTKTIRVSFGTYKDLERLGTLADSFDSVIQGLLASCKKNRGVFTEE
jgi:predicted CopG family antitoxin